MQIGDIVYDDELNESIFGKDWPECPGVVISIDPVWVKYKGYGIMTAYPEKDIKYLRGGASSIKQSPIGSVKLQV